MNKTVKQLRAQRRKQRKKDAKKEAEARMAFEGPGPAHAIEVLSNAPTDTTDWDTVIQKALDEVKITQKEVDQREHILGLVEQTLKPHYPRVICRLFGSSKTRLGFKDSNTDIHLSIGYDPYNNTTKKEGEEKASKLVRQLADCFKGHSELTLVGTHVGGRAPLVKLNHVAFKTRVDLSFGKVFAVANSSLVRLLCDSHPQVRPFLLFLRLWAITQEVAGRGRPKFRLTNYALTRLALFTCMAREQRLVPSLEDLRKQPYDSNMIDGWECGHGTDVTAYWQQQEKGPPTSVEGGVLALALEFFELYAGLDYFRWAVCPLVGKLVDRQIIRRAAVAVRAAGGPESDCDTDGEEATTDDDNDRVMITNKGAEGTVITDKSAKDTMQTDNDAKDTVKTDDGADDKMITYKGAEDNMKTDNGADDIMVTDMGAEDTMKTDNGADDIMITDEGAEDTMKTDNGAKYTVKTDNGAKDIMITDKGAEDTIKTDNGAEDTMKTDNGADDITMTDKGADDTLKIEKAADDTMNTDKGADDSMNTDDGIDDAMITETVGTAAAVGTDSVATVGTVATDAVTEKAEVTADTALEGASDITDTVAKDAAVSKDNLTCSINYATATNDNNASNASNNVSSTAKHSANDSGNNNSLPEALVPHLARITKAYKSAPLCVMDLFALDTNFTYQYHLVNLKSFQEKCRKSAEIIKETLKQERSLSALFTKFEVSS